MGASLRRWSDSPALLGALVNMGFVARDYERSLNAIIQSQRVGLGRLFRKPANFPKLLEKSETNRTWLNILRRHARTEVARFQEVPGEITSLLSSYDLVAEAGEA